MAASSLWHALPARDEWLRLDCGKHLGEIWIGPGKVLVPLFDYVQGERTVYRLEFDFIAPPV